MVSLDLNQHSSTSFPHKIPTNSDGGPVDELDEGDDATAKEEAKESAQRGNELNWSHRDASLKLFWERKVSRMFIKHIPPMTVSCPKKMLRVAKSSSQALYVVGPP